jgi:hypothetical protein
MGFHIDTHHIPAFRDFADASQHENTVTPIQGSGVNAGKKPLTSSRRATHMTIRRERNIMSPLGNQGMAIMCQLYRTDCVIFYEDNSVTLATGGWNTISTRMFINAIIHRDCIDVWTAPKDSEGNVLYYHSTRKAFLWRDRVHLGVDRLPIDPEPCVVHRVNRRAMNEVRKLNAPFLRYAKSMIKVAYPMGGILDQEEYQRRLKRYRWRLDVDLNSFPSSRCVDALCSIMREDNIEDWADALDACAMVSMQTNSRWPSFIYSYRPDRILKVIDELLKYGYSDAVFTEVTLPLGEVKADSNEKYVR